ncbi:hypothetical protein TYRP_017386 [Tyrophagus putrescentiae]|nr:hypothetical protein TYRP_017386 [Tyrophagus putrescentiae]
MFDPDSDQEEQCYYPAIQGCRYVESFQFLNRVEEGKCFTSFRTYGVVYRAKDKESGEIVALKRLKMDMEKEGFPITSLREISTLLKARHENVVGVKEIVVGSNHLDKIYLVMEYVDRDLKSMMDSQNVPFTITQVKSILYQLISAIAHLHANWILHRDLKTSNLLVSKEGVLKVGDFGLAREYGSPLKDYTPLVVTLWYRAPELLLQAGRYSYPVDNWSIGCIFAELVTFKPLFQGQVGDRAAEPHLQGARDALGEDLARLREAARLCTIGSGGGWGETGFSLLNRFLTYYPEKRVTAEVALEDPFFDSILPKIFTPEQIYKSTESAASSSFIGR